MYIKIYLATILVLFLVSSSDGECCRGVECPGVPWGKTLCCADGTSRDWTHGNFCCGKGQCNIFCCNCGGGCRRGHLRSNSNPFESRFWTSEFLSGIGEALAGRKKRSTEEIAGDLDHFSSFDTNGDRSIDITEIREAFGKDVDNFPLKPPKIF